MKVLYQSVPTASFWCFGAGMLPAALFCCDALLREPVIGVIESTVDTIGTATKINTLYTDCEEMYQLIYHVKVFNRRKSIYL